jgi:hypothetical protein
VAAPSAVCESPDPLFAGDASAFDFEDIDSTWANDEEIDFTDSFPDVFRQIQAMKGK